MKTSPQDLIWQTLQRAIRCLLPLHQNLAYPPSNPILLESGHLLCIIWLLPTPLKFTKLWTIHEACIGFHLIFKRCTWECRKNMDGKLELVYACFCGDFSAFCFGSFLPLVDDLFLLSSDPTLAVHQPTDTYLTSKLTSANLAAPLCPSSDHRLPFCQSDTTAVLTLFELLTASLSQHELQYAYHPRNHLYQVK